MASEIDRLATAAATGNLQVVTELLNNGVDPNATNSLGRTPIQVMMMGHPKIARLLIEHGAEPSLPDPSTGTCPAHDAIREGFVDTLLELLNGGASLYNPMDNFGQRPIDLASDDVLEQLNQLGILNLPEIPD
ncbi:PREDICTED: cyclin-dependent kinase 4 inhibitor B-like [Nanorana parkeri]|uniref:cyclin-dependent kinase 4 inhibitor B-like n=1 Tax=Nanorana parkeri TaxID=125878 RepID=UPI0008547454|nr:PREDICTED: cyclin-dependent kinase 4 inhibitor B-like [Nanorana parkeri]